MRVLLASSKFSGAQAPTPQLPPIPTLVVFFSPYHDITNGMDWNSNSKVMYTRVTGSSMPVTRAMLSNNQVLTWAFATGECGSETWANVSPSALVTDNVQAFVAADKKYIISAGGHNGMFKCSSVSGFDKFIKTYDSSSLAGVDLDIEGGAYVQSDVNDLVRCVQAAQASYPHLRFSFTLPTLGADSLDDQLGIPGMWVLEAIKSHGLSWTNLFFNLMTMDYGPPSKNVCTLGSDGKCDMGASAVSAAKALHSHWNVPYSNIELTPMIGGKDDRSVFTMADASTVTSFACSFGLGGVHFWSLDRDKDCPTGPALETCNNYDKAGTLGFTKAFLNGTGW
ncbi:hypothetical protein Vretimale_19634 [Volvox reticuliferus]|uniref:Uncharacterized protein n=1 Tax=Volvox reticuliferus TaxID=1737510 RepID=A0A8J4FWE2_9CHLO|nr:hypothetical protein Vretifemale_16663 [Volvox reticuliferus]GIM17093.1 hypothetical protein Vretimale_19634 [Volvox reticuliferus]